MNKSVVFSANAEGEEALCHVCECETRHWNIFHNMLLSMKNFMEMMRAEQQQGTGKVIMELSGAQELVGVIEVFQTILSGATSEYMRSVSKLVGAISNALGMSECEVVNFDEWISSIDTALVNCMYRQR